MGYWKQGKYVWGTGGPHNTSAWEPVIAFLAMIGITLIVFGGFALIAKAFDAICK